MNTYARLKGLRDLLYGRLCSGREMKAPGPQGDLTEIVTQEPGCYIGFAPGRMDRTGYQPAQDVTSAVPSIIIMPSRSYADYMEEKRFDRYNNVKRPQDLGQHLSVCILFQIYEPGVRLPGFAAGADETGRGLDMTKFMEGTEQGMMTLLDWMDEAKALLIGMDTVPGTDLFLYRESAVYSPYEDQNYIVDRRPIFIGYINVDFGCYAERGAQDVIEEYLK